MDCNVGVPRACEVNPEALETLRDYLPISEPVDGVRKWCSRGP